MQDCSNSTASVATVLHLAIDLRYSAHKVLLWLGDKWGLVPRQVIQIQQIEQTLLNRES